MTSHIKKMQPLFCVHLKYMITFIMLHFKTAYFVSLNTNKHVAPSCDLSPIAVAVSEADPCTRASNLHRPAFIKWIIKAHREPGSSRPSWGQGWHHYPRNRDGGGGRALWCDSSWTWSLKQPAFIHYGCVVCSAGALFAVKPACL